MKKLLCLLAGLSLLLSAGAVLASTKAVLGLPVLGVNGLADDLYLFSCADSSCAKPTQLADYGHITNVPRWPKGKGGPGGPVPQVWVFLTLKAGAEQYFQFWQQDQAAGCWKSCILAINADGGLDTTTTTCLGTVPIAAVGDNGVPSFTLGAAMFSGASCATPPTMSQTNTLPDRSLTFVNNSSANKICLQTDSTFNHPECAGAQTITQSSAGGQPYVISSSDLKNGGNSGAAQVSGYLMNDGGQWVDTGRGVSGSAQVYATNLEWTVWPQHAAQTMGPTTVDISLVNGFNAGASLSPDRDCVCSVADTEGGVPYFVLYKANTPMGVFPNTTNSFDSLCPSANQAPISQDSKYGCYSSCSKARYYQSGDQDQMCCSGAYNTPGTCTDPPNQPYVQDVNANSERVYSWAFNDWRGTFTCEPTCGFTFTITEVYQENK